MIVLDNITLAYGDRTLLSDVSARFEKGTFTALLGRNGCGKSTLLRAIAGIGRPTAGRIEIQGLDMASTSPSQAARTVSFVTTQRVRITNLTCRQVAALGRAPYTDWIGRLRAEDRRIVDESLEAVGMSEFAGRTMDSISDGEAQRVMIARALAHQTPVILLDEPTAFLDLPTRWQINDLLRHLARDEHKTILCSTHDLEISLSSCDAVALVDTPRLIHRSVEQMRACGDIERTFGIGLSAAARHI